MAFGTWRYRCGLLLIAAVVLIWVASAEVTQAIFSRYRHPFLLTWLGAALLSIYLPISFLKDKLSPWARKSAVAVIRTIPPLSPTSRSPRISALDLELQPLPKSVIIGGGGGGGKDVEEEKSLLIQREGEGKAIKAHGGPASLTTTSQIFRTALVLAPMWLLTEYLSNAALSLTSVASTTILSSTSALFTLLVGASLGHDQLTTPKVLAVLVCISGVIMTELGKTSALDELGPPPDSSDSLPGHSIVGDFLGLASAASYGFYTVLLKKSVGGEEGETDMQKVFGYIGLVTLLGLWWLVVPLVLLGWEPALAMPSSKGLDEDILFNCLVGSVISDYFWALSVVWTTPLVATLGLSLTIPLAMVADMVIHGRSYSLVYVLGSLQVFGGFLIANARDTWSFFEKAPKAQG